MKDIFSTVILLHAQIKKISSEVGGGGVSCFFSHEYISQRALWTSLEKQLDNQLVGSTQHCRILIL